MIACICGGVFELLIVGIAILSMSLGGFCTHMYNAIAKKKCCEHKCKRDLK